MICPHCNKEIDEKPKKTFTFETKAATGQTLRFSTDAERKDYDARKKVKK